MSGDTSTSFIPEGAVKPSSLEVDAWEGLLHAHRITEVPSNLHMMIDYNSQTDGNPLYVGYGPAALGSNVNGWLIQKYLYDANTPRQCIERLIGYGAWSNRASVSYS